MKYISLTVIGKDKMGIVEAITKVLNEAGCNITDSTMTILQGRFAMILIISVPQKNSISALFKKLKKSSQKLEMNIYCCELKKYSDKKKDVQNQFLISVYGADKTGIVHTISKYLFTRKINIIGIQTKLIKNKNKKIYLMFIETEFTKNISQKVIEKDLKELSKKLNVSVSINSAENSRL
jgi:glycine cleavage system transcriptional repressor